MLVTKIQITVEVPDEWTDEQIETFLTKHEDTFEHYGALVRDNIEYATEGYEDVEVYLDI